MGQNGAKKKRPSFVRKATFIKQSNDGEGEGDEEGEEGIGKLGKLLKEKNDVFGLWRSGVFLEILASFYAEEEKGGFFENFDVCELEDTIDIAEEEIDKWRVRSGQLEGFLGTARGWLRNRKEWAVGRRTEVSELADYESPSRNVDSGKLIGIGGPDGSSRSPLRRANRSPLCNEPKLIELMPAILEEDPEVHHLGTNLNVEGENFPQNTTAKEHKFTKKVKTANSNLRIINSEEISPPPSRRCSTNDFSEIINSAKPVHSYKKVENSPERAPSLDNIQETPRPIETTKSQTSQDNAKGVKSYLT